MATNPIQLKTWVPISTKPSWDWKAKNSPELAHFTVPFAAREYLQNINDRILKDLKVREWRDWSREDFRHKTSDERAARKRSLAEAYPGLFTGPHGVLLKAQNYLPLYILSATIVVRCGKTNLMAVVVVWSTGGSRNALSFFNNHLDEYASFESFVVDGKSTSKHNQWALGTTGRGFILATQYLAEHVADADEQTDCSIPLGISFRIGEQVGELKWKMASRVGSEDSLQVIQDDLTIRSVGDYLADRYMLDIEDVCDGGQPNSCAETMAMSRMREEAAKVLQQAVERRVLLGLDGTDGKSVVRLDEVCITVIGIAAKESEPEHLFSAIFGIIPSACRWCIPNSPVEFFLGKTPQFYHRNQLVPHGIHLNKLSINYHGDLILSSDRAMVQTDRTYVLKYKDALNSAIHSAFRTFPYLAVEIAADILTDDHSDGFAGILSPPDEEAGVQYRTAFETVWRRQMSTPLELHPCTRSEGNLSLFPQLGLEPVVVTPRVMDILYRAGAYVPVTVYAGKRLLESPVIPDFSGLDRIRGALRILLPSLPTENITVRQYSHGYPSVVLDEQHQLVAFAQPQPCEDHPSKECLCPIGPGFQDMVKQHTGTAISIGRIWRALAVGGTEETTAQRVASVTPVEIAGSSGSDGHISTPSETAAPGSNDNGLVAVQGTVNNTGPAVAHLSSAESPRSATNMPGLTGNQKIVQIAPDSGEAAANVSALAQFSKFAVGFDLVQKYNEIVNNLEIHRRALEAKDLDIRTSIAEKDQTIVEKEARIAALEEDNKRLSEDLAAEEEVAIAAAERAKKRRKTA
ncbi:hypothetical protein MSAN_01100800 [Mycena sanguinolenta]|uniref:Uncharacterized protein n=1 Tax=Mycena sanguinolenta TaxID=230812 RepID=A0A8H6YU69_9AGAR|nr:hypothetical protein MSAN_01100800 [Mycena sanguinolenta]